MKAISAFITLLASQRSFVYAYTFWDKHVCYMCINGFVDVSVCVCLYVCVFMCVCMCVCVCLTTQLLESKAPPFLKRLSLPVESLIVISQRGVIPSSFQPSHHSHPWERLSNQHTTKPGQLDCGIVPIHASSPTDISLGEKKSRMGSLQKVKDSLRSPYICVCVYVYSLQDR